MTRQLDDVQDELYARSPLHGDIAVEHDAARPARVIALRPNDQEVPRPAVGTSRVVLNGSWLMNSCDPPDFASERILRGARAPLQYSQGILEGWHRPGATRAGWLAVQIPTTVQRALVDAGELPDPLWDTNTIDELQDYGEPVAHTWHFRQTRVERKEWWFATSFQVPDAWEGEKVELYFDGLDYAASIYLDGLPLAYHEGMFGGPELEVSGLIQAGRRHELVVRIHPAPPHWRGILKGSPGWGWHYGHLISLGIWREVILRTVPRLGTEHLFVRTVAIAGNTAHLEVEVDVRNQSADITDAEIFFEITDVAEPANPVKSVAGSMQAAYGINRARARIELDNAELWWPKGYGTQHIYKFTATVRSATAGPSSTTTRFGVRTIEMQTVAGLEGEDFYRWRFVINGRQLFVKGANWCWTDPYLKEQTSERVMELTDRSGVQMLRAWGGGMIESDSFYEECDRRGILVYQEFPLSFGPNDAPATDLGVIDRQVQRIIRRLRNHPSLVMWGGGNENETPLGTDDVLFLIGRRCRRYDPSRPYHRTDPWGGSVHNYDVFHQGRPMDSGYTSLPAVFYGEFGIPSMPNLANARKFLPPATFDHWPPTKHDRGLIAHMHQFTIVDFVKVMRYADYGPIRDWPTFVRFSQLAQADALRFAAERQRARPEMSTGFWFYKMTELFPGASWGVIDFHGAPKTAFYRARQVCAPRLAFATYDQFDWLPGQQFSAQIHVSNDSPEPVNGGELTLTLFGSDLTVMAQHRLQFSELRADQTITCGKFEHVVDTKNMRPFFLAVEAGTEIEASWYWFNVRNKSDRVREIETQHYMRHFEEELVPEAFAAYADSGVDWLGRLPTTHLSASVSMLDPQEILVANTGSVPALDVALDDGGDQTNALIEDSHFCLRPGQARHVRVRINSADPAEIGVSAWNADRVLIRR